MITINALTLDSSSALSSPTQEILQGFPSSTETAPPELHAALDDLWARLTGHESNGPVESPPVQ